MQALEVAYSVSKQFVVEIEKQFHSYRQNICKISAKFSLDSIFVEKYGLL